MLCALSNISFNFGDIIATVFILIMMVGIIVFIIRLLITVSTKVKHPASQNNAALAQQVHELTIRINKLEQQLEERKKVVVNTHNDFFL